MDGVSSISHLARGNLSGQFVRDFSFELFDKTVAFSESLADDESGAEKKKAHATLVDFVLVLSESIRSKELFMMAIEKLASANIVSIDTRTLCLLYFSVQLSCVDRESQLSGLSLVIQSTCSRCSRAKEDADGDDLDGAATPHERISQSLRLALAFYQATAAGSRDYLYERSEAELAVWPRQDGGSSGTDSGIGAGSWLRPEQEARVGFLLSLAESALLLAPPQVPPYVALITSLVSRQVCCDVLFGFAQRARRFLLERKTRAVFEARNSGSSSGSGSGRGNGRGNGTTPFSDLIWGACCSALGREVGRRHRGALTRQLDAVLGTGALLRSWDAALSWNLVTDEALKAALRLQATEDYARESLGAEEAGGGTGSSHKRRCRWSERGDTREAFVHPDEAGLSVACPWSLLGLALIAHHALATDDAQPSTYPSVYSVQARSAHGWPYLWTLLQHTSLAQAALELICVVAPSGLGAGLEQRLFFASSLALQTDGETDPLSCLATTASADGVGPNDSSVSASEASLVSPLAAAVAHALSADTLSLLQGVSQILAAAPDEACRDRGVAALRLLLGAMDEGCRYAVLVRLSVGEEGEGGCPYEAVRGMLLDLASGCMQAASRTACAAHQEGGIADVPLPLPPLSFLSAAEAALCREAARLEYQYPTAQGGTRSLFWSPFLLPDFVLPALAPFKHTNAPPLPPSSTSSSSGAVYRDAQLDSLGAQQQGVRAALGMLQFFALRLRLRRSAAAVPVNADDLETVRPCLRGIVTLGSAVRDDLGLSLCVMNAQRVLDILEEDEE